MPLTFTSHDHHRPHTHTLQVLRAVFTSLMTAPQAIVTHAVGCLVARLAAKPAEARSRKEALALELDAQYPGGDVGVLSAFFLNLVSNVWAVSVS